MVDLHREMVKSVCDELAAYVRKHNLNSNFINALASIKVQYADHALVDLCFKIRSGNDLMSSQCSLSQRMEGKKTMLDGCKARKGHNGDQDYQLANDVSTLMRRDTAQYFSSLFPIMSEAHRERLHLLPSTKVGALRQPEGCFLQ